MFHKVDVPGPLLARGPLWFDSCKRPPPISDNYLCILGGRLREVLLYIRDGLLLQIFLYLCIFHSFIYYLVSLLVICRLKRSVRKKNYQSTEKIKGNIEDITWPRGDTKSLLE